jgi:hypothetical protein
MHYKNELCYPELESDAIDSNWRILRTKTDIDHNCNCTMSELCKALLSMEREQSRIRMNDFIHASIDEQKNSKYNI